MPQRAGVARAGGLPAVVAAATTLAAAAAVAATVFGSGPAEAASRATDGKIVFGSNRTGAFDIWVMNADGSGQTDLTADAGNDQTPRWSPDGRRIAFSSERGGGRGIFVMDADGRNPVRVTSGNDYWPAWTADGRKLVFNRDDGEIYRVSTDGSGLTNLTNNAAHDAWPATSPTSDLIAFRSDRTGDGDLYVMRSDGSELRRITSGDADESLANWSPAGNELEFVRDADLFRVNVDSGAEYRVTSGDRIELDAAWAPSGDRIVFQGCYSDDRRCQIFTINPDGSGERQLTDAAGYSYSPNWQAVPTGYVSVQTLGDGSGTVRDATGTLDCGETCLAPFTNGAVVQLVALPDDDSVFTAWSGGCSGASSSCSLTVTAETTVGASFAKKRLTLTVRKVGSGTVTSRPAGIACGRTCRFAFAPGPISLNAKPAFGWRLASWQGVCRGAAPTCRLTLDRAMTATARFTRR